MNNNKTARLEIRLPKTIKNEFNQIALNKNTTMSKLIYDFILSQIKEVNGDGKIN